MSRSSMPNHASVTARGPLLAQAPRLVSGSEAHTPRILPIRKGQPHSAPFNSDPVRIIWLAAADEERSIDFVMSAFSHQTMPASALGPIHPLFSGLHPELNEVFPRYKVPIIQSSSLARQVEKHMFEHSNNSRYRGVVPSPTSVEEPTEAVLAEETSAEIEEGGNCVSEERKLGKIGAARWRSGPGRKKSWKSSPMGKRPSRRQRRRAGRESEDAGQSSYTSLRSHRDHSSGHGKDYGNQHVQEHQRRKVKHRKHYPWDDDIEGYAISVQKIVEPRISCQAAESSDVDVELASTNQLVAVTPGSPNLFFDWAAERGRREEATYQQIMADMPSRLPSGPEGKGLGRRKQHKQRGINKFSISGFDNLEDLRLSLEALWVSLLEKSILLRKMATRQERASNESYMKLYKTIQARQRQVIQLEYFYATMDTKYKRVRNNVRVMTDEMNQILNWLSAAMEQYQVSRLQSALHKDRFIYAMPQPNIKSPPRHPLLYKHVLEQDPTSISRLLERTSDCGCFIDDIQEVYTKMKIWELRQLSFLRRELQSYTTKGN